MRNHERLCKSNPNRQTPKSNFIGYHEKIKAGLVTKLATNQHTKAKLEGRTCEVSEETRKKLSDNQKKRKLDTKTKEKISIARSKILEEVGGGGFTHIKYYDVVNLLNETYKVRGTWELKIAEWLTVNNILWVRKKYIQYIDNDGVIRTYTPDFYIPSLDIYLEVKGYFSEKDKDKLDKVVNQNKIVLFLIQSKHIKMLDYCKNIQELLTIQI